jgi:hypothetical protein
MADYFPMIVRLGDYMLKHRSQISKPAGEKKSFISQTVPTVIPAFVSLGILLALVFAFIFAGNLVRSVYPSCWFLRNLEVVSLPINFLIVPACLGVSWFLARMQHRLLTVNGIGTQLYGSAPILDSQGFIATKWLTIPWIPLLPVRSYLVTVEGTDPWNKKTYSMQPLNDLRWAQVKETIRKSRVGYGTLAMIYLAFTVWSFLECG